MSTGGASCGPVAPLWMQLPGIRTLHDVILPIGVVIDGHYGASYIRHVLGCEDVCITECQVYAEALRRILGCHVQSGHLCVDIELPEGKNQL